MKNYLLLLGLCLSSVFASAQRLIVRMDDIAASHSENLAVIHCYKNGIGRSAEVMPVCAWFPEAVALLNENPGLDVGVHIAFRSEWIGYKWRPLTNCPSLCDEDGYLTDGNLTDLNLAEIEAEMRAQIEFALKKVKNVTHITDHCMWTFYPGLLDLAIKVAADYGLRYQGQPKLDEELGIYSLPMEWGGAPRAGKMLEALKKMEPGKTYWTIEHPAFAGEEMDGIYHLDKDGKKMDTGADRQDVTDTFTNPEIMQYIKEHHIELVSFGDVMREKGVVK
ncbi:MAG: ChbG/HpnK family deacetylase [Bacteroidaceae bacterium]|nr:ChbG/HpnK family deacetylase [Bacteroidaceae bacterium]MCF0185249.1 ChbG/HpnK family deacetylase [Bacteroidaceae bacterium]